MRSNRKSRKQSNFILYPRDYFIFGGFFIICLVGLLRVVVQTEMSTDGVEVATLQKQIKDLKLENDLMYAEILEHSALTTISRKAEAMGFREATADQYIYLQNRE